MKVIIYRLLLVFILSAAFISCREPFENITSSPEQVLRFSTDTVFFDTLITAQESPTRRFKIYNPNSETVVIEQVSFNAGSPFRAIVNGKASALGNIEIPGKDSIYVLLSGKPGLSGQNLPVLIEDTISFKVRGIGTEQRVIIHAFGQDVQYYEDSVLSGNITWLNDNKPFFIKNSILVDKGASLTINAGVQVYNYANSNILVKGKLTVKGTKEDPVVFKGTRQEAQYDRAPNQWGGIAILAGSSGNRIDYAEIRNCNFGIQIGQPGDEKSPDLILTNTFINAVAFAGLYCFGSNLEAYNNLITDCGTYSISCLQGGNYTFVQNTVAYSGNYGFSRRTPTVVFTDYFSDNSGTTYPNKALNLSLVNNIITGSQRTEVAYDLKQSSGNRIQLANNLIRSDNQQLNVNDNQLVTRDFRFANAFRFNFRYDNDSLLVKAKGFNLTDLFLPNQVPSELYFDIDGISRPTSGFTTIGAYQTGKPK